jgi:predicted DCC family thiol-disulfide oxidoreductase YuxK
MTDREAVLLYDGSCGFCQANVQFVLRHERRHTLNFAPLQGAFGSAVRERHPELAETDSVVWVSNPQTNSEQVVVRSSAAIEVLKYLGGPWRAMALIWFVPRPLRNWAYDLVARHRHHIPLGDDNCLLPDDATQSRFLD